MRKTLVLALTALMVLVVSVPSAAATLKVTGEYIFNATYWNGQWWAVNPAYNEYHGDDGAWYEDDELMLGSSLLDFSQLKLKLSFAEGDNLSGYIPLNFFSEKWEWRWLWDDESEEQPYEPLHLAVGNEFYFSYAGNPFKVSVAGSGAAGEYQFEDKTGQIAVDTVAGLSWSDDYGYSSIGDPLGLAVVLPEDPDITAKASGKLYGVDTTLVATLRGWHFIGFDGDDTKWQPGPTYLFGKAELPLPTGHKIGGVAAVKSYTDEYEVEDFWWAYDFWPASGWLPPIQLQESVFENTVRNWEVYANGPLFAGATFTGAFASSNVSEDNGVPADKGYAYLFLLRGLKGGAVTLDVDLRGVDKNFVAVAPDTDSDSPTWSAVSAYANNRQFKGTATVAGNVAGKAVTFKVWDDYRTFFNDPDYSSNPKRNDLGGSAQWTVSPGLTAKLEAKRRDYLYNKLDGTVTTDDYKYTFAGTLSYAQDSVLSLSGGATVVDFFDGQVDEFGLGTKVNGALTWKPMEGVQVAAEAAYLFGTYDVDDDGEHVYDDFSTLNVKGYAEAKQSLTPSNFKSADVLVAGYCAIDDLGGTDPETTYVGYGEVNFALNDKLSNKLAVLAGVPVDHYSTTVYNELKFAFSADSTLTVGYSLHESQGNLNVKFVEKIGTSTLTLGYGRTLLGDPCEETADFGKPWAWLCSISDGTTRNNYYTLKLSIPF